MVPASSKTGILNCLEDTNSQSLMQICCITSEQPHMIKNYCLFLNFGITLKFRLMVSSLNTKSYTVPFCPPYTFCLLFQDKKTTLLRGLPLRNWNGCIRGTHENQGNLDLNSVFLVLNPSLFLYYYKFFIDISKLMFCGHSGLFSNIDLLYMCV